MSESLVNWKEPPTSTNRVWREILEEVMERPGEWAHVRTMKRDSARTTVYKLRNRREIDVPDGEWQFEGREVEGVDAAEIYARFLGDGDG